MIAFVINVHPIIHIVLVVVVVRIKRWLYKELSDRFHSTAAVTRYGLAGPHSLSACGCSEDGGFVAMTTIVWICPELVSSSSRPVKTGLQLYYYYYYYYYCRFWCC